MQSELQKYIKEAQKIVFVQRKLEEYRVNKVKCDLLFTRIDNYLRGSLSSGANGNLYKSSSLNYALEGGDIPGGNFYRVSSNYIKVNKTLSFFMIYDYDISHTVKAADIHLTDEWYFQASLLYSDAVIKGFVMMKYIHQHETCPTVSGEMTAVKKLYQYFNARKLIEG